MEQHDSLLFDQEEQNIPTPQEQGVNWKQSAEVGFSFVFFSILFHMHFFNRKWNP